MDTIKVEIITIGDEILIGQIIDTNSAWMATQLNQYGFEIHKITSAKHRIGQSCCFNII